MAGTVASWKGVLGGHFLRLRSRGVDGKANHQCLTYHFESSYPNPNVVEIDMQCVILKTFYVADNLFPKSFTKV